MERKFLGIDIGSTAAKAVVLDEKGEIEQAFTVPTGWSSLGIFCCARYRSAKTAIFRKKRSSTA